MGYDFIIGEKTIDDEDEEVTMVWAEEVEHENAPAFGEPTDYSNERWPSYTVWHYFCKDTGLYELFYERKDKLIPEHPGYQSLTPFHQQKINTAYKVFKANHPEAELDIEKDEASGWLCRLEWLKYWVDWALENCENPVFCNR